MTTMDGRLPAQENDDPAQPIGRVNLRPPGSEDFESGWNLKAVLFGILALAIMLVTLLIVLQWALEPMPA